MTSPGLLEPLLTPKGMFTDLSMEFIIGLPKTKGKEVIIVVVDRLAKYTHFIAQAFLDNIYRLHDLPCSIVSDRDLVFINTFWRHLFWYQGVSLKLSFGYHPQTEVVNRCLETYLWGMTSE